MEASSKLTSKFQATIPKAIRERLGIGKGDVIVFDLHHEHVIVRKATPLDLEYLSGIESNMSEWDSPEDQEAYRDL